jgi:hypothetical protein
MKNDITKQIYVKAQGLDQLKKQIADLGTNYAQLEKILKKFNEDSSPKFTKRQKEIIENIRKQIQAEEELNKVIERRTRVWAGLEKGRETFIQKAIKYKGITGAFKFASDKKAEQLAGLQTSAKDVESQLSKTKDPNERLELIGKRDALAKQIGDTKTAINKINTAAMVTVKAVKLVSAPFVSLAKGAWDVVKSFTDLKNGVATFATATSLITNATAREQQLKYGLSSSQNFAFTQAKSMLNIQSDEDLMYMNVEQRNKFLEYMQRYSKWYDQMESSGVLKNIQEMQLQFQELKQQLGMELLSWLAANKETIMICVKGIFEVIKQVANFVMAIASWFAKGNTQNNTFNITATTTNNVSNQTMADTAAENQLLGIMKQTTAGLV